MSTRHLIDRLCRQELLSKSELIDLIAHISPDEQQLLCAEALRIKRQYYGDGIFLRGLIEFTNYCKNDCHYCGIRAGNRAVVRYRLSKEQILDCCAAGYALGMRTFVLQGGEGGTDCDTLCDIVAAIRARYPDCAITLSVGELSADEYRRLFAAGANRYLLRHETASHAHYQALHPPCMTLQHRIDCLYALKDIGFQTGAGFMVGSPHQTTADLAEDLLFLRDLQPHMVGIGPFIPQSDTIFSDFAGGTLAQTCTMLALTRLLLPRAMIPSTTALESIAPHGRMRGFLAGANVIMVNLSPDEVKEHYLLYDNKAFLHTDAHRAVENIRAELHAQGMELLVSIGNPVP